jgi:hypothetical protein
VIFTGSDSATDNGLVDAIIVMQDSIFPSMIELHLLFARTKSLFETGYHSQHRYSCGSRAGGLPPLMKTRQLSDAHERAPGGRQPCGYQQMVRLTA